MLPDRNCSQTSQSLSESDDRAVSPAKPSRGNPDTNCKNDKVHNLNGKGFTNGGSIKKIGCESASSNDEKVAPTVTTISRDSSDKPDTPSDPLIFRNIFPHELEHGFYIEMGGYELVSALEGGEELPPGFNGRVTSRGAIELARFDQLPEVR